MLRWRASWMVLVALMVLPQVSQAQVAIPTESAGPGVPFLVHPVFPAAQVRFQNNFAPVTTNLGPTTDSSTFIYGMRFEGAWAYSDSVIGEASLPLLLTFPSEGDGGFDLGNVRLGIEAPLVVADGRQHRWTLSFDLYLPFSQISRGDEDERTFLHEEITDTEDQVNRRVRYATAATVMPMLAGDYLPETLTPMLGTHYRLFSGNFQMTVGLELPIFMDFDFSDDIFFDENNVGLRYGVAFAYAARPVFPTLEFAGLTTFTDESTTALLATLGVRTSFANYEPGIGITYPITIDNEGIDTSVYVHFDFAYRFGDM